jgi:hypothetical protein
MLGVSHMIIESVEIFISISSGLKMGVGIGRCHLISSRELCFEDAISSAL